MKHKHDGQSPRSLSCVALCMYVWLITPMSLPIPPLQLLELHANPAQMAATRPELLSAAAQSAAQLEAMIQTMEASATLLATPKPGTTHI